MKVVLFCGGLGLRLRDYSDEVPKPMVRIGSRPILWHLMKYYAHYGHRDFVLCLGHKADVIKNYFVNYCEYLSNDFILEQGGDKMRLLSRDIEDWSITFVDTGLSTNIGQRLKAVEEHVDDDVFLANYSDNVTAFHLPLLIETLLAGDAVASFLSVKPHQSFHVVRIGDSQRVSEITEIGESGLLINGGFFVFRPEIFDFIKDGEDLVYEPFSRLISQGKLATVKHDGFWACMDTFKDKQVLESMHARGDAPWEVWRDSNRTRQETINNGKMNRAGRHSSNLAERIVIPTHRSAL